MSDRDAFLKERLTGLGGSDAATVLGLNPWRSPLELYLEKRGQGIPFDGNAATHWGTMLEPVIRQEYANRTQRVVRSSTGMLRHPTRPYMIAHLDGLTDDARLFEAKTARTAEGWGEPGTDQIPLNYLLQVQHYMVVANAKVSDVAVLIGGQDFRIYEVPADIELQIMIAEAEEDFWNRVQAGEQPDPDWKNPRALEVVRSLYQGTDGTALTATPEQAKWGAVYFEAKEREATYKAAADNALAHLLYEMGAAATLTFDTGKVLRRKLTKKKGYTVEPTEYLDCRFVNAKE